MKNGLRRFLFYIDPLNELLKKASVESDPAMYLLSNNARTPLFMLEALSRIYKSIAKNKDEAKKLKKYQDQFKKLEDGLGLMDYYQSLDRSYSGISTIPQIYKDVVKKSLLESASSMNQLLREKWFSGDLEHISKIKASLEKLDWLKSEKEISEITKFYESSIGKINKFIKDSGCMFKDLESEVHELRRKLRWLSIYPQALQGVFQYSEKVSTSSHLEKYLTKEIVESPFNKLPLPGINNKFILLNKNYFLSLSWIISELGKLKDEGLLIIGLSEAIEITDGICHKEAIAKAQSFLPNEGNLENIIGKAQQITKTFFAEKNLKHLVE